MYRILTIIAIVLLPGCSRDTQVVDRALFNSHARCAAFYVLLGNSTSSPEKKQHYASSLENHVKVGLKLIPDQNVFQSQFKIETQLLTKEWEAQADDQSAANYILSQTGKCAYAFVAYTKYIGAAPRPMD